MLETTMQRMADLSHADRIERERLSHLREQEIPIPEAVQAVLENPYCHLAICVSLARNAMLLHYQTKCQLNPQETDYLSRQRIFLNDCARGIYPYNWSKKPKWSLKKRDYSEEFLKTIQIDKVERKVSQHQKQKIDIDDPDMRGVFIRNCAIKTDKRLQSLDEQGQIPQSLHDATYLKKNN